MALGSVTHLWIFGAPSPEALRSAVLAAMHDAREDEVLALRLGPRTLLAAVNTSDRAWRRRSIDLVSGVRLAAFETVFVAMYPDVDAWELISRTGEEITRDDLPSARLLLRELVPLELKELHHYVEWAQALEETSSGQPAPALRGVNVEVLSLGLPPATHVVSPVVAVVGEVVSPVLEAVVQTVKWGVLIPYLLLGLAGPLLAWWYLLPGMMDPPGLASLVTIVVLEAAFALPFALIWRRMPRWSRWGMVVTHALALGAGLVHAMPDPIR